MEQILLELGQTNDICWVVTCYNELEYVAQCLTAIRSNDSGKIILINDGGNEEGLQDIADKVGAKYVNSGHYKTPEDGWKWWQRFFALGVESGCEFIVKLDPDSYFIKPLEYSLAGMNYFGTIPGRSEFYKYIVQGGIQGFSCCFARQILSENKPELFRGEGIRLDGSFSTDSFISLLATKMNTPADNWAEIYSVFELLRRLRLDSRHKYSIVHPVTLLRDTSEFTLPTKYRERFLRCRQCPHFDRVGFNCAKNNSYIYAKMKVLSESCPIGLW